MPHDVQKMIYVGEMPWHGLGVRLPAANGFWEFVRAAGFYEAVEREVFVPPNPTPSPTARSRPRRHRRVPGRRRQGVQGGPVQRHR